MEDFKHGFIRGILKSLSQLVIAMALVALVAKKQG